MSAPRTHDVFTCDCGESHCSLDPAVTSCELGGFHCDDVMADCRPCQDQAGKEQAAEWRRDSEVMF